MHCQHCSAPMAGRKRKFCDPSCRQAYRNARKRKPPVFCVKCDAQILYGTYCATCRKHPDVVRKLKRAERERAAARQGRVLRPLGVPRRAAEAEAKRMWRKCLERASDGWHARYWKAKGQPWLNPRLPDSIRYRIQYRIDPQFRAYERARSKGHRKRNTTLGRVSKRELRGLISEHSECLYCGVDLNDDYHFDHMQTRSLGGRHEVSNLAPCCAPCNLKKRAMPWADWLQTLRPERRAIALRHYWISRSGPLQLKVL